MKISTVNLIHQTPFSLKDIFVKLCLFSLFLFQVACQAQQEQHEFTNKLINSSSPYLLQHAHNPVNWFPWGDEALKKAKEENKLLVISIGYAACHWCHVMEHESFEDSTVAQIMNDNFVSIKVDREERPDIDQIYMNAAQLLTGRGGWPLNAIALPDGRPVFVGTYLPKSGWLNLLRQISGKFENDPDQFEEVASQLTQGIKTSELIQLNTEAPLFERSDLITLFDKWSNEIDFRKGGVKGAPKFPMPSNYQYLLKHYYHSKNEKALQAIEKTLEEIANGGIYDHLGGGFARYSTDSDWFAPHFEKMLYDNAQLVSLYSTAYRMNKKPLYKKAIFETLEFVKRELSSPEGAFYSSLDADTEGEEGKFYVWTKSEIDEILGDDSNLFCQYFNIRPAGNWEEGKNILHITGNQNSLAEKYSLNKGQLATKIQEAKQKLFEARNNRIRPALDNKVLTAWNGLMITAYVEAYQTFGEEAFLQKALKNAAFLKENVIQSDFRLNRNYKDEVSSINAFLDDYAFLIDAFIHLYQATFEEKWLFDAQSLAEYALAHFYDESSGMFYYTSDLDPALVARKMEVADNVIPSSNSQMARNLHYLGLYLYHNDYIDKSKQMLNNVKTEVLDYGQFYSNWANLMSDFIHPPYEVAIVGQNYKSVRKELGKSFLPNVLLLGGEKEGKLELLADKLIEGETIIYVCQDKMCRLPVAQASQALKQIKP